MTTVGQEWPWAVSAWPDQINHQWIATAYGLAMTTPRHCERSAAIHATVLLNIGTQSESMFHQRQLRSNSNLFIPELYGENAMSTTTRLYAAIKDFPDPVLAEILDFAEFLREKRLNVHSQINDEPLIKLAGGLENFKRFADDPLALQARMRDEWN